MRACVCVFVQYTGVLLRVEGSWDCRGQGGGGAWLRSIERPRNHKGRKEWRIQLLSTVAKNTAENQLKGRW